MNDKKIHIGSMSRETAIGILKLLLESMQVYDGVMPTPERINALQMAIDSLEVDEAYQLEYERTTKNDLGVDCNNCKNNLHRGDGTSYCATGDGMCHYECKEPTPKNDLGVDAVSRKAVHDMLENLPITVEDKWFNWLQKACMRLAELPPVTPQEPFINKPCVSEKVCEYDKQKVLDKIRAEISELDDAEYDFDGYYKAVTDALRIIDKYKVESEKI